MRERRFAGATAAVEAEVDSLKRKKALDFEWMMWKSVAMANVAKAEFVRGMMILGLKREELGRQYMSWKGRFVALGNAVQDVFNRTVVEKVIQRQPTGLGPSGQASSTRA